MEGRVINEISPQLEDLLRQPINDLAYQIHLSRCKQAGQPVHGRDLDDWIEAKVAILAEMNTLLATYNRHIESCSNSQPVQAIIKDETGDARSESEQIRQEVVVANS